MIHREFCHSHEEWLTQRDLKPAVGGSEIGAVLGLNPYMSAFEVWARKLGRIAPKEDNEAMRQGRDLEEYVAQRFCEKSGLKVRRRNAIITNDDVPHLMATIDRQIEGSDSGLECKTVSPYMANNWRGTDIPAHYYAQCVAYMTVLGWPDWYLAALVYGRDFKVYHLTDRPELPTPEWAVRIDVDPGDRKALAKAAEDFWTRHVETKTPPPTDGSDSTGDALAAMFPGDTTLDFIDLPPQDWRGRLDALHDFERQEEEAAKAAEAIRQEIKFAMGDAEEAHCGATKVTWRTTTTRRLDSKALAAAIGAEKLEPFYKESASRRFTIKEPKPQKD